MNIWGGEGTLLLPILSPCPLPAPSLLPSSPPSLRPCQHSPVSAPADMSTLPDLIALILDDRSGAPLPMATNVTVQQDGTCEGEPFFRQPSPLAPAPCMKVHPANYSNHHNMAVKLRPGPHTSHILPPPIPHLHTPCPHTHCSPHLLPLWASGRVSTVIAVPWWGR